jgi:hypothetical protein
LAGGPRKDLYHGQYKETCHRCYMCKRNGESVDYFLLHCEVVGALYPFFPIDLVYLGLCLCWWTAGTAWNAVAYKIVPSCLLWSLLRKMNDRSFEDCERTLEEMKSLFFYTLYF